MLKTGKLVQDENVIPKAKYVAKPPQFYWDSYQGPALPPTEINVRRKCQVMSHGKAKSVLGLWKKGSLVERKTNEREDFTEGDIREAFRSRSKVIEDGGRNDKEYTLQDIHEAYQVLLKSVRKRWTVSSHNI